MNKIKEKRLKQKMSQIKLAKLSGIKYKSSISRIENERVCPTLITLKKIANALKCKVASIYDL